MDLEVFSRHDAACETFLPVDPSRHDVLPNTWPWLDWARQFAPNSRLFVYRHRETGLFVLSTWVYTPEETMQPVLMELENFSGSPTRLYPDGLLHPALLTFRLRPAEEHREKWARQAKQKVSNERTAREERIAFRQSRAEYLRRRGMDRAAWEMKIGQTPLANPTADRREMWVDALKSARRAS